jgi:hypothetical protein
VKHFHQFCIMFYCNQTISSLSYHVL